jgi:hypothetical protein
MSVGAGVVSVDGEEEGEASFRGAALQIEGRQRQGAPGGLPSVEERQYPGHRLVVAGAEADERPKEVVGPVVVRQVMLVAVGPDAELPEPGRFVVRRERPEDAGGPLVCRRVHPLVEEVEKERGAACPVVPLFAQVEGPEYGAAVKCDVAGGVVAGGEEGGEPGAVVPFPVPLEPGGEDVAERAAVGAAPHQVERQQPGQ